LVPETLYSRVPVHISVPLMMTGMRIFLVRPRSRQKRLTSSSTRCIGIRRGAAYVAVDVGTPAAT
jgi:hypothetical protein